MFTQKTLRVPALLAVLFQCALAANTPCKRAEAYASPLDNGGSMLTNAGDGFGEPLNVRPPTQSILCTFPLDSWRIIRSSLAFFRTSCLLPLSISTLPFTHAHVFRMLSANGSFRILRYLHACVGGLFAADRSRRTLSSRLLVLLFSYLLSYALLLCFYICASRFMRIRANARVFLQVIISGLSSPDVLTDDGFLNYVQSIGL